MLESKIEANKIARTLGPIDPRDYILQNPLKLDTEFLREVVNEYQFLVKLRSKLPTWARNVNILGGDIKAIEQCSTPETAKLKFDELRFDSSIDLTGGYGVDSYFMSKQSKRHFYNELNEQLASIVEHNFLALGCKNIRVSSHAAEQFIEQEIKVDLIYLDPDRRSDENNKLVLIEQCRPNMMAIQDRLLDIAKTVVVKFSPMLDISLAIKQLKNVYLVKIISIKNEVKELVFYLSSCVEPNDVKIQTINLIEDSSETFESTYKHIRNSNITFDHPKTYLYEPNAAIMKSGLWNELGEAFSLQKIASHSHFYTCADFVPSFPGRKFKILETLEFNKKTKKQLIGLSANVVSRNFGIKADELRRNLKIKEGSEEFLIFTSDFLNKKIVIKAIKINQQ